MKLLVLISGNGSNLQAIIDYFSATTDTSVCAVISNRADAYGLERAKQAGIPSHCIEHEAFASREQFDLALSQQIDTYQPELIVLAGFMRKLTAGFVERYYGKVINIHPSLLPKYRGLHTHQKILDNGDKEHGVTIHYVSEALDGGPIIAQTCFQVEPGHDLKSLEARTHRLEHQLYPRIIEEISNGSLKLVEDQVYYQGQPLGKHGMVLKI